MFGSNGQSTSALPPPQRVPQNFWLLLQLLGGVVALFSLVFFYVLYLPVIACIFIGLSVAMILAGCVGDRVTVRRARRKQARRSEKKNS